MRWMASLGLILVLTTVVRSAAPDDQYLSVYNEVLQADSLQQSGQGRAAADKYLEAQKELQKLKATYPAWNPDVISFRLQYVADKLQALGTVPSSTNAPAAHTAASPPGAAYAQQIAALQEQVRSLTAANGELESKLKEALSVQPAAVSPVELAKREQEIVALKKEKDLLNVALDQAKAAGTAAQETANARLAADLAAARVEAGEANRKLDAANRELTALKASPAVQTPSPEIARLTEERDQLKDQVAQRTKELADAEAHGDRDVLAAHAQLKEAQDQRDELQKKLAATVSAIVSATAATAADADATLAATREAERLRARLAVFEAKAVPYTPQELAILNQAPSKPPAQLPAAPAAPAERPHVAHSAKDLPPGAGALMADAMRASMERDYTQAEEKYQEILRQDENNVYVLAHLANAQFAEGHLDECEKTVVRALALDPDDPASLYLLGVLRYRQEKLDQALDALSRSAKLNSTNAGTQNYLGCVLADKGMRPAAETALRTALRLDPDYPDAHYNLAFIYATEKPPSPELARWHYKRAVDLGHDKSPALEALLAGEQ